MELLCPECMGPLRIVDAETARCTVHSGQYRVLFAHPAHAAAPAFQDTGQAVAPGTEPDAPTPTLEQPPLAGVMCGQHPQVVASHRCKVCGTSVCATCDFTFAGDVHLCPKCAAAPRQVLTPRRRKLLVGAYALAGWCTLGMVAMFSGVFADKFHTEAEQELLGVVLSLVVFVPAMVGTGLGVGAFDRRLGNPLAVWVAGIWNGIILGLFVLLCIIGSFR